MKEKYILAMYFGMLIFDFALLAATAYLVQAHGWSAWWFVLALMLCDGSSPQKIIVAAARKEAIP